MHNRKLIKDITSIVIIGSGNVASQLAQQLVLHDIEIKQIYSRNETTGVALANRLNSSFTLDLSAMDTTAHLYLLAVNDDSIANIVQSFPFRLSQNQIIAHTSGATPSAILSSTHSKYGCIWPILSISTNEQYQWLNVPFGISGSDSKTIGLLEHLIAKLSKITFSLSDDEKSKLHLAATIVNNFSNHLYDLTEKYCNKNNLEFKHLIPMLNQQVTKLNNTSPSQTQTGPAERQDYQTIDNHIDLLHDEVELTKLYELITSQIINKTK